MSDVLSLLLALGNVPISILVSLVCCELLAKVTLSQEAPRTTASSWVLGDH